MPEAGRPTAGGDSGGNRVFGGAHGHSEAGRVSGAADPCAAPISVVVCTRDRPEHLVGCLRALAAQSYPSFEVLVVDSAPADDRALRVATRAGVRYLREERAGVSIARNRGIEAARHGVIAFTDDDTRPEPSWLAALAEGLHDPDVAGVTGLVLPAVLETSSQVVFENAFGGMGRGLTPRIFRWRGMSPIARVAAGPIGVGANVAFRRALFDAIGGFDPSLGAGSPAGGAEDVDLFHRTLAAGYTIRYAPSAVVRQHHRRDMASLEARLADAARGYAVYLQKLRASGIVRRPAWAAAAAVWWLGLWVRAGRRAAGVHAAAPPVPLGDAQLRGAREGWQMGYGARAEDREVAPSPVRGTEGRDVPGESGAADGGRRQGTL